MNESNTFERIEQYLAGALTKEEQLSFENQLQDDRELKQELTKHHQAHQVVNLYAREQIKQRVKSIQVSRSQSAAPTMLYRLAAAVVLVALTVGGYLVTYQNYSDAAIAGIHFEPYPNRLTTMGELKDESFFEAMTYYDQGDYQNALSSFALVESGSEHYEAAQLYLGIAHYSLDQYDQAVKIFQVLAPSSGAYAEAANWYLALSYLQLQQHQNATPILRQIAAADAYKAEQAREILDKLDSPLRSIPGI
jgi:tetratricopeptide (TPR) repeat protein